jgi:outer membrane protein
MKNGTLTILLSICLLLTFSLRAYADDETAVTEINVPATTAAQGQPLDKGFHGVIGAGLVAGENIVGHRHASVLPFPIIILRYSDWAYWHFQRGGVWVLQSPDRSLKLGVGIGFRLGWRSDDDDSLLRGMADRYFSLDGSVNAEWLNRIANIRVRYYHDILGISDGDGAEITVSHRFPITQKLSVIPFVGMEWQSNRMVNYYYGVRPEEVTPNRSEYRGRDAVNLRAGLAAAYLLSESWSLMGGVHVRRLGDGIYDSPIVLDRYRVYTFIGAGWRF